MSDPITLTEAERESVESTLRWHFNVVAEDGKDSAYISVGIANALRRVQSILAARLAEVTAEIGELRLSRAEFADEAQRLRNHLAGLSDLRGLRRAYDTACEQTESEMDRRIAAEAENARLRDTLATVRAENEKARRVLAAVEAIHKPIKVYEECEHDADHGCVPIEVHDYMGCSESVIGWGCSVCCYDDEYPLENCPHGADHQGVTEANSCPTRAALAGGDS